MKKEAEKEAAAGQDTAKGKPLFYHLDTRRAPILTLLTVNEAF